MPRVSFPPPAMSPRSVQRLKAIIPWAALLVAFSAGGAWALQRRDIEELRTTKADRTELSALKAQVELRDTLILRELQHIRATGDRTATRVRDMWCAGKPPGCQ